jgi:hypothetical protein
MKGAIAKASRLLAAIDELAAEESIWLKAGNAGQALASHLRSVPLLAELCSVVSDPTVAAAVGGGLARLNERRQLNQTRLGSLKSRLLADGERIAGARLRLGRLSSAYGAVKGSRLRAAV